MNKILELREKRGKLWEQTKAFLDSAKRDGDILSAEDVGKYEKMEADIVAMGREIEMLERQAQLELELNAPVNTAIKNMPKGNADTKTGRASENYNNSYWKYMRNKNSTTEVLNALQIGGEDGSEGGYLVPDEFEATLIDGLTEENIIRQVANVISTSFGEKKIPVVAGHGSAAWTDEEAALTESDDSFGMVTLGAHKLTTIIKVSEELINDSVFSIENYLAKEFARRMASAEEEAFIIGNGTGKPTGVLVGAEVGVTAAAADSLKCDELIDLYHSLKTPYRKKAVFITNDATIKAIRKFKDTVGNYIWQPSLTVGNPDTILNSPVKTSSFMPIIAANAKTIMFGDFSYYWIADRQGRSFQRLNELYAATGQVGFKAGQRVDGKLTLNEAVKVLQMKSA